MSSDQALSEAVQDGLGIDQTLKVSTPEEWPEVFEYTPVFDVTNGYETALTVDVVAEDGAVQTYGVWLDSENNPVLLTPQEASEIANEHAAEIYQIAYDAAIDPDLDQARATMLAEKLAEYQGAAQATALQAVSFTLDQSQISIPFGSEVAEAALANADRHVHDDPNYGKSYAEILKEYLSDTTAELAAKNDALMSDHEAFIDQMLEASSTPELAAKREGQMAQLRGMIVEQYEQMGQLHQLDILQEEINRLKEMPFEERYGMSEAEIEAMALQKIVQVMGEQAPEYGRDVQALFGPLIKMSPDDPSAFSMEEFAQALTQVMDNLEELDRYAEQSLNGSSMMQSLGVDALPGGEVQIIELSDGTPYAVIQSLDEEGTIDYKLASYEDLRAMYAEFTMQDGADLTEADIEAIGAFNRFTEDVRDRMAEQDVIQEDDIEPGSAADIALQRYRGAQEQALEVLEGKIQEAAPPPIKY